METTKNTGVIGPALWLHAELRGLDGKMRDIGVSVHQDGEAHVGVSYASEPGSAQSLAADLRRIAGCLNRLADQYA